MQYEGKVFLAQVNQSKPGYELSSTPQYSELQQLADETFQEIGDWNFYYIPNNSPLKIQIKDEESLQKAFSEFPNEITIISNQHRQSMSQLQEPKVQENTSVRVVQSKFQTNINDQKTLEPQNIASYKINQQAYEQTFIQGSSSHQQNDMLNIQDLNNAIAQSFKQLEIKLFEKISQLENRIEQLEQLDSQQQNIPEEFERQETINELDIKEAEPEMTQNQLRSFNKALEAVKISGREGHIHVQRRVQDIFPGMSIPFKIVATNCSYYDWQENEVKLRVNNAVFDLDKAVKAQNLTEMNIKMIPQFQENQVKEDQVEVKFEFTLEKQGQQISDKEQKPVIVKVPRIEMKTTNWPSVAVNEETKLSITFKNVTEINFPKCQLVNQDDGLSYYEMKDVKALQSFYVNIKLPPQSAPGLVINKWRLSCYNYCFGPVFETKYLVK